MLISSLNLKFQNSYILKQNIRQNAQVSFSKKDTKTTQLPLGFNTSYNIVLGDFVHPNRLILDVDLERYSKMSEQAKRNCRKLYESYSTNTIIDKTQLFDKSTQILPLSSQENLEKFVETSKIYLKYKDQPIICLGRSPKWFLNTAFWMKDGIPEYKFVAFSGYWFYPGPHHTTRRLDKEAPTKEEEAAYRKYLDRVGVNPQTIVDTMQKTGKKTVITDYICSGKGACSFLDIMSRYANDLGILEDFSKSIQIVGIGSMDYMEILNPMAESISIPSVPIPPLLEEYANNIHQKFYNMDYDVFEEMLLNRNTNECRSTYYPHSAWTVYSPDTFKTGLITDMKKVGELLKIFNDEKYILTFSPPMQDYRNLLNFRILDYLDSQNMLRQLEN